MNFYFVFREQSFGIRSARLSYRNRANRVYTVSDTFRAIFHRARDDDGDGGERVIVVAAAAAAAEGRAEDEFERNRDKD